jgi:hypothetical protein
LGNNPGSALSAASRCPELAPLFELDAEAHAAKPKPSASANTDPSRQNPERIAQGYLTKVE